MGKGWGRAHCGSGANGSPAQAKGEGGNLLEYPVTVVGVLGLWSFIAGGTLRGAEDGHSHSQRHTQDAHDAQTPGREGGKGEREQGGGEGGGMTRWRRWTKMEREFNKLKKEMNK